VPFVDNSEIRNDTEAQAVAQVLTEILPEVEKRSMFLALETSLDPEAFEKLLQTIDHPNVKVNYDIGNSAALGYDPAEEMDAYGTSIATVHVKDRVNGGGTVPPPLTRSLT
jgi:hexulose-6-phosphate isomerase